MINPWPYPRRIAHRGAGLLAPENTLAALRCGAAHGYTMFEFDAKLSADGVPILMHDATLARTTGESGQVADRSWSELALLDAGSWHSAHYAGEGVPTLARVGAWLQANRLYANIEIKPCPGREVATAQRIVQQLNVHWRSAVAPPLLSSFSEAALAAARAEGSHWPRALLLKDRPPDWLERCLGLDCVAIDLHERWVDVSLVQAAHRAGLRVLTYTVNDPERVLELESIGVDGVITDALDRIRPA
jgi:glycerophosphoryl diester phosphodiesterase